MFSLAEVKKVIEGFNQEIFVSEAHLQLRFAMQIDPQKYEIYPEYPADVGGNRSEFDLLIRDIETKENTLIEFKYKTANGEKEKFTFPLLSGIEIPLRNHSAIDNGWYDSWKDISRIEQCVKDKAGNVIISNGFFVLITNDKGYWEKGKSNSKQAVDGLHMNQGKHSAGKKCFKEVKAYRRARNNPIIIKNDYNFDYLSYRTILDNKYGEFKVLVVEVK